ncbi:MAG: sialidase family protein [Planctomycetia bacterium]|nr:sialidase family protein [Planctomycetia bacterium]
MNRETVIFVSIALAIFLSGNPALAQEPQGTANETWRGRPLVLDPRCTRLPFAGDASVPGLVELADGSLLTVQGSGTTTTRDDGKTWSAPRPIEVGPGPGTPSDSCVLVKTKSGVLVMVYMDIAGMHFAWDTAKNETTADTKLDVWAVRSLDEGKTWIDRQRLLDGYCGALIGIIQTSAGRIVAPIQCMLDRNRHATFTCVSDDDGKTWLRGNVIDLGGRGDHVGAMEATVAELAGARVLMLLRTSLDRFWEAYSDDGRYWREIRPSQLDASSAPGYLVRLASGRLALVWNRLRGEGKESAQRSAGGNRTSEPAASWHREELSLAFSSDDGKTWTKPVVIARVPGGGLSYPYLFERRPGELWVITRFDGKVCLSLKEADFVGK